MIVRRFYDENLAQASWLVGCAETGAALVVDPSRDVDPYIGAAERESLEITHVTETHIHADFVSGSRELAEHTGGRLHLSDEGGADWKYAYASASDAVLLKDGDLFMVGNVRVRVMHTPGHTPEHVSLVVTDTAAADEPMGVFTGDFLFVGDVGRPDLLETAAGVAGTMEAAAADLFRSLQRFKRELPDFVQIWPGHGAGSACGKALGAVPQSTLGYERRFNWALRIEDEQEFVEEVLAGQPEPPKYFAEMKRVNKEGPRVLGGFRLPQRLSDARLAALLDEEAVIIDTRQAGDFAAAHVPGTLNIPLNRSFSTWAGWLTPYDRDFYLILDDRAHGLEEAVRDLAMIGLDRLGGYFGVEVIDAWKSQGRALDSGAEIALERLEQVLRDGSAMVLDVRGRSEWEAGHLPGVENIPVGHLVDRLAEIPRDRPVVVHCESGGRSAIAASVLRAHGFRDVLDAPGFADWRSSHKPVERAGAPA
ncbi:MAG TPA: rhodanese-like domain-containing protein [Longimicrobiales bacterium]|nr:rhodanese-like domain-containing protein [Longimicrobiales bacterium]